MKEIVVNGSIRTMLELDSDDVCPICGTPVSDMRFTWNMFHGEATSNCCNSVYQIKSYYINDPNEEEKELLSMLGDLGSGWIELRVLNEWIIPLRKAMYATGIKDLKNPGLIDCASNIKDGLNGDQN